MSEVNTNRPADVRRLGVRLTAVITASVLGASLVLLIAIQPDWMRQVGAALAHTNWGWLTAAVVAQVFSVGSLARQQRRLLTVSGRLLPLPSVVATTYVGGAISLSLPIIGKAAAAVYSYRRFTAQGVEPAMVGWALAMSAFHLTLAFLTVSAAGAFASGSPEAITAGILAMAAVVVPVGIIVAVLRSSRAKRRLDVAVDRIFTCARRVTRRSWQRSHGRVRAALDVVASARMGRRDMLVVTSWSLVNIAATLAAFALSILAVGGRVPWPAVVITWAAAFGAGQLGVTPGGIGIVEAALTLGLVTAGMPATAAIAAALVYRVISFWMTAAAGSITFLLTPHTPRTMQR